MQNFVCPLQNKNRKNQTKTWRDFSRFRGTRWWDDIHLVWFWMIWNDLLAWNHSKVTWHATSRRLHHAMHFLWEKGGLGDVYLNLPTLRRVWLYDWLLFRKHCCMLSITHIWLANKNCDTHWLLRIAPIFMVFFSKIRPSFTVVMAFGNGATFP